VHSSLFIP
jgi:cohesin loading factor subunit SCC2